MTLNDQKDKRTFFLYYLFIAVITIIVYYPSLFHVPRSDHFIYLANTATQKDFISLTFRNYALNRMALPYGLNDEILFRPLLCIFLGIERWLFDLNSTYWQLAGIILHLTVLYFLFKYLYEIRKSFWAFLLTLYFAVLFAGTEMVVWSHINGYMIFIISALIALNQSQKAIKEKRIHRGALIGITLALGFAVFTHELGVIFCLLLAIFFSLSFKSQRCDEQLPSSLKTLNKRNICLSKRTVVISFLFPILLYCLVSSLDFHYRHLKLSPENNFLFSFKFMMTTMQNAASTILWWLHSGLFPSQVLFLIGQRTFMYPFYSSFSGSPPLTLLAIIQTSASIGLVGSFIIMIAVHMNKTCIIRKWKILSFLFCLFSSYALLTAVGRINTRGLDRILIENTYYHYFFWIFFILFIYNLIPFNSIRKISYSFFWATSTALLIVLIAFNYYFTSTLIYDRAFKAHVYYTLDRKIQTLIKQESKSKEFSFGLDPKIPRKYFRLDWAKRSNDPPDRDYNYLKLLYPEYYKDHKPKYIFTLNAENYWDWQEVMY